MRDVKHQLQDYWSEITSDLPEPSLEAARQQRVGDGAVRPIQDRRPAQRRPAWGVSVAAFAGVLLLGGVIWLLGLERDSAPVGDQQPGDTTSSPAVSTTTAGTALTIVPAEWSPILADTHARQAPPAAACPPGTEPDRSGPSDQERPRSITHTGLTAAFDRHAGRIVYVDAAGATWTFDVCTNTWQDMDPVGTPYESEADLFDAAGEPSGAIGDLVYDVDSDRTVVFGHDAVHIYDANTNTWTADPNGYDGVRDGFFPFGAVYDPVSGLILTTAMVPDDRWELWAYDVDTETWTLAGTVSPERATPCCTGVDLLGYSPQLDRLLLATFGEVRDENPFVLEEPFEELTLLLDPRTGAVEILPTASPLIDLGWPSHSYGQAAGTVFVKGWPFLEGVCGFDTGTLEWTLCFDAPGPEAGVYSGYAAMVDDPISDRLVFVNGRHGDFWRETDAAVWAIDLRSGDVLTLVAPADGS